MRRWPGWNPSAFSPRKKGGLSITWMSRRPSSTVIS
uniref:Uncharacterized protein n=1 Tax=Arundo donax TaxID=35708 RepID=A0A0A8YGU8_ARUDO